MCDDRDYKDKMKELKSPKGFLKSCRNKNRAFHDKVLTFISKMRDNKDGSFFVPE